MSDKDIVVVIPTYNRPEILGRTIELLMEHLKYEDGRIVYAIGDDSEKFEAIREENVTHVAGPRKGLGANLNSILSVHMAHGYELYLQMDDDHWLTGDLDLTPHARKLREDRTAGWIRLMQIAGHKYTATLDGKYWRIHWDSHELYIPSNRPHLKHWRFHHFYGFYPEGRSLGHTEESFCNQCKDRALSWRVQDKSKPNGPPAHPPDVLIPLPDYTENIWDHVGDSWQMKGF